MARHGNQRENQTELSAEIARIIKVCATERGIDNKRLAELSGLSGPTLTRTFSKGRVLDLVEFESLASALGLVAWQVVRDAEQNLRPLSYDEITQAKLAQALQSDYAPAAKKHKESE